MSWDGRMKWRTTEWERKDMRYSGGWNGVGESECNKMYPLIKKRMKQSGMD